MSQQTTSSTRPLEGRVAFVTGSTGGIGRAIAVKLAELGASIGVSAMPANALSAESAGRELETEGAVARAYTIDVRSETSIREVIDRVHGDFGRLDILVNNAGVRLVTPSLQMTASQWDEVFDTNLRGLFLCSQAAAGYMRERGGVIVNIASQLGIVAARDRAAYCASKAGVIHLTHALALDWSSYKIRVNAVAPGPVNTPSLSVGASPQDAIDFLTRMPLGRPIQATEVAEAACFLASPAAEAITGHVLVVDGGWTLS